MEPIERTFRRCLSRRRRRQVEIAIPAESGKREAATSGHGYKHEHRISQESGGESILTFEELEGDKQMGGRKQLTSGSCPLHVQFVTGSDEGTR